MKKKAKSTTLKPAKKRDSHETRRRLIEAAMQLFSNVGYDATTTKMIAKKAKVNEALIHRYFESKNGLLIALFINMSANEAQDAPDYPFAKTLDDELYNFMIKRLEIARLKHKEMRLIISRAIVDPKLAETMAKQICRGGMPGLMERLQYWKDKGEIRSDIEIEGMSFGISGYAFVTSFFGQLIFCMDAAVLDGILRQMAAVIARGLRKA
jgi:AcrR family transcriptional regulator